MSELNKEQVEKVLDQYVRPLLHAEGGDITVDGVHPDGRVSVFFTGRCAGCPGADLTIDTLVTRFLKEKLPEIRSVNRVNWHLPHNAAAEESPPGDDEDADDPDESEVDEETLDEETLDDTTTRDDDD